MPDVILKLDDELAVDLDIKTKLPSPVMLPKAVASFTALLFNLIMLIMIYSIHTFLLHHYLYYLKPLENLWH